MLPGYYYGSVIHLYSWSCGSLFHTFSTKHSTIHLPVSCSPDNLLAISLEEKKKRQLEKNLHELSRPHLPIWMNLASFLLL